MQLEKSLQINSAPLMAGVPATIHLAQRFSAVPEQLFRAWVNPTLAERWLFATATRRMSRVAIDPRPGGRFEFADDFGAREHGRYLDIQPGRRLVFSLARAGSQRGSKVVVEFSRHGSGCLLSLTHSGLPADQLASMEGRWEGMLYGLGLLLDEAGGGSIAGKSLRAASPRRLPLTRE